MEKVLRINVGAENGPVATIEELGRVRGPWRARYDDDRRMQRSPPELPSSWS